MQLAFDKRLSWLERDIREFCEDRLWRFDTSKLRNVRFVHTTCASRGYCQYPGRKIKAYRITIYVPSTRNGQWPDETAVLGWQEVGTTDGIDPDLLRAGVWSTVKDGRWMHRVPTAIEREEINSGVERAVFVFGHELYHWLRHSRQVPGRNTQNQANLYGIRVLREWKEMLNG